MGLEFRTDAVRVRAPATSANLGPGFDALGLALGLYDDVIARIGGTGLRVDVAGEGEASVARDETHLIVRAMWAAFDHLGGRPTGLELACTNRIPHGRGLGSSAAAIVAGILLARGLVEGGDVALADDVALAMASRLEGHPDNVAACLLGGLTVAWTDCGVGRAVQVRAQPPIRPIVLVAPSRAETRLVRGLLPDIVPHADASFSAARSALLVGLLCGTPEPTDLLAATEDRLHQPYRAAAMPQTAALVTLLRAEGLAAVVSGAGPSVLVLAGPDVEVKRIEPLTPSGWAALALAVDGGGARIVPGGGNTPRGAGVAAGEPNV